MSKKLLSMLALLCLTVTSAWADDSGTCGTSLTWSYVESTHTLTISGTGAMTDFGYMETPWYGYRTDITNIVIEDGVTTICEDAFSYCDGLTTVTIPNNVTTIGDCAFEWCSSLEEVTIGSGVTSIGDRAFEGCSSLTDITVSGGTHFKSVKNVLFTYDGTRLIKYPEGSTATSYTIPNSVTTIDMFAFAYSSNLTGVTIGSGVTTIGAFAFAYSSNLTGVTIPNTVTSIGNCAFGDCSGLTTMSIPSSVTYIGDYAFDSCTDLATITLNSNPYIGDNAFYNIASAALVTMNLTANAAGGAYWMTFFNDNYSFEADPNTQVFQAELDNATGALTLREIDDKIVNAKEAVILKSSGNPVMTLTTTNSSDLYEYNNLIGVNNPEGEDNDGYFYVLNNGSKGVGFYKLADGKKLGYGKAYLSYDSSSAPELDYLEFNYGNGNTTGVNEVRGQKEESSGEYYDLQGRRVAQPAKGLYIVNGKKVVIK